jgi:hypothetical protein
MKITNITQEYFKNKSNITIEDIIEFLSSHEQIRWTIFREKELNYYKEDLENIVENYNAENDTNYTFTDDEYSRMVERYEDNLADHSGWYEIGYSLVSDWCDDKAKEMK